MQNTKIFGLSFANVYPLYTQNECECAFDQRRDLRIPGGGNRRSIDATDPLVGQANRRVSQREGYGEDTEEMIELRTQSTK